MKLIGKTTVGGFSFDLPADTKRVARYNVPVATRIVKLSIYVDGLGSGVGTQVMRGVVYDASGTLIAMGDEVMVNDGDPASWVDLTFSSFVGGVPVLAGLYDFGVIGGANTNSIRVYGDGVGSAAMVTSLPLTVSGFEITDPTRAANASGDGRGYVPVTNLVPNGGAEVNLTNITNGFGPGSAGTSTRITTDSKFGVACHEFVITTYAGASWAFAYYNGLPLFVAGETYTLSYWVKVVSGTTTWQCHIGDTTSTNLVMNMQRLPPLVLGVWTKVSFTFTALQTGSTPGVFIVPQSNVIGTLRIDGVQVEVGHQAHDYVDTQNNAPQTQTQRDAVRNYLNQSGFEVDASEWASWVSAALAISTTTVFEGQQSLRVTNTGGGANTYGAAQNVAWLLPVSAGAQYTLSGYVYSTAARNFQIVGRARNAAGAITDFTSGNLAVPANQWTRISFSFTVGADTLTLQTAFQALLGAAGEVFYLDALQLETGATATAYMPPGVNVQVSLDQTTGIYEATTNLLNGDFETNTTGWTPASSPASLVNLVRDNSVSRFGQWSMRGTGVVGQALTIAGTPITDALRALNVQGDGRGYQYVFNQVTNGGFEVDLAGWTTSDAGAASITRTRDTTVSKFGVASMKLVNSVAGEDDYVTSAAIPVTGNTVYTVSAWVNVTVFTAAAFVNRGLFINNQVPNQVIAINITAVTAGWVRITSTFTTGATDTSIQIRLYALQGTTYWDGIQFEVGAVAHDFVNTQGAAAGAIQGPLVTNRVANGGFEAGLTGWTANGAGVTHVQDATHVQFGTQADKVTTNGANSDGIFFPGIRVDPGPYIGSAYVWAPVGFNVKLVLEWHDSGGALISGPSTAFTGNGAFQRISVTGSTPANAASITFAVYANGVQAVNTFWVDGVQVESGITASTYVDSYASQTSSAVGVADGSYGIHEGTTNLIRNGGAETNLADSSSAGVLAVPAAPTVAVNVAAGTLNGAYLYKITFVNARGETTGGTTSAVVNPASQQVDLTAIPIGGTGTTQRKIYRTAAGGVDGTQKLVTTIANNTATTFTDNVADGSLGAALPGTNTANTAAVTRVTTASRFGTAAYQVLTDGAVTNEGIFLNTALGLARGATDVTGSCWVKGAVGVSLEIWVRIVYTDASIDQTASVVVLLNGDWQRFATNTMTSNGAKVVDRYEVHVRTGAVTGARVFFVDGAQIEEKKYATPYVHTDGGSALRTGARASTTYSNFLSPSQGHVTFRMRMGYASSELTARTGAGAIPRLLDWTTDTNNRIYVAISASGANGVFQIGRLSGGVGSSGASAAISWNAGDYITVTARWDAANVYMTVNNVTTSSANTSIPALPATIDFGSNGAGLSGYLDTDMLWVLTGTGTLAAGDLTALFNLGNSEPATTAFPGVPPLPAFASTTTMSALFPFATAAYSDFLTSFPNVRTNGFAATAGQPYAFSTWVQTQPGQQVIVRLLRADFSTIIGNTTVTATGGWQRISAAGVAPATETIFAFVIVTNFRNGGSVWIDGAQLENKVSATPFAPASRTRALVQAPSALLSARQGWVAMRMRMSYASVAAQIPAASPTVFAWQDSSSERLRPVLVPASSQWQMIRQTGGAGAVVTHPFVAWNAGDVLTVIFAWTDTQLKVSVNGVAFTVGANSSIPTLAATLFEIGSSSGASHIDADVLWFIAGVDVPSDTDAATIHGFGNTVPTFAAIPASPSMLWPGGGSTYVITQNGQRNNDTYTDGASNPFGAAQPLDYDLSVFGTYVSTHPVPVEDEFYYARLPFDLAQKTLDSGKNVENSIQIANCGWHGTRTDPERGSFVLVNADGPLADLVGERLRITSGRGGATIRSVVAYCHTRASLQEDLSLPRRLFFELGIPGDGSEPVEVLVVA